jgi:Rrf2 family nitric oxide-sensitive transcriptional repressor
VQLTRFTDLGLRILMRLAVIDDGAQALTTQAVADQMVVSYTHAAKVVTRLQALGLVQTRRGRTGGLSITDAGRTASVGLVARRLEGKGEVIDCDGDNPCPLADACRLRSLLVDAREAFFTALDPWTIRDLTTSPAARVLLTISERPADV